MTHFIVLLLSYIGFHPGRVEPTSPRAIAAHVRRSCARSHEMASQSRFRRRGPTTWGPDSAARLSLIVLARVFSYPPTCFRQLGREVGRSTSWMSSPSGRWAACPNQPTTTGSLARLGTSLPQAGHNPPQRCCCKRYRHFNVQCRRCFCKKPVEFRFEQYSCGYMW